MNDLRELTDTELDIVGGGITMRKPTGGSDLGIKLVEEILVDILKILEGNQPGRPMQAQR
jgi:hypothetical protein